MSARPIARKHHYLPQSYLAAFTETGEKDGQFRVLDVETGETFQTSPLNVGARRDFNRVDMDGHRLDAVETALAPFEGDAVNAVRRVIQSQQFPSDDDWNWILNLLGLIAVRNPRLRGSFNRFHEQVLRQLGDFLASDKRLFDHYVQKARDAGEDINPDVPFEEFQRFIQSGDFRFEFHPQGNLRVEFSAFDKILPVLGERIWSVLIAPPNAPEFICSDHPVTLVWKPGGRGPIGFGTRNTEVFFPLGRRVGFYGVFETPLKPVVKCRPLNVAIMNRRVASSAGRHVYSALGSFSIWQESDIQEVSCAV